MIAPLGPTPFEALGGEAAVRALVDRFYDLLDTKPEAAPIRAMHPPDLQMSREKLFLFLVGWLGGPPLYVQRFGHPRLRARHLPFPIEDSAAAQWMSCMSDALAEQVQDPALRGHLDQAFRRTAQHMRNLATGPRSVGPPLAGK